MSRDELEDRVQALETLVLKLIQHLNLVDSLPTSTREQMVDSLLEIASGDRGAEFQARRLQQAIEGTGSSTFGEMTADYAAEEKRRRDLYGPED